MTKIRNPICKEETKSNDPVLLELTDIMVYCLKRIVCVLISEY